MAFTGTNIQFAEAMIAAIQDALLENPILSKISVSGQSYEYNDMQTALAYWRGQLARARSGGSLSSLRRVDMSCG